MTQRQETERQEKIDDRNVLVLSADPKTLKSSLIESGLALSVVSIIGFIIVIVKGTNFISSLIVPGICGCLFLLNYIICTRYDKIIFKENGIELRKNAKKKLVKFINIDSIEKIKIERNHDCEDQSDDDSYSMKLRIFRNDTWRRNVIHLTHIIPHSQHASVAFNIRQYFENNAQLQVIGNNAKLQEIVKKGYNYFYNIR